MDVAVLWSVASTSSHLPWKRLLQGGKKDVQLQVVVQAVVSDHLNFTCRAVHDAVVRAVLAVVENNNADHRMDTPIAQAPDRRDADR